MAPWLRRVVSAVVVAALSLTPAVLGACAARCGRDLGHAAATHGAPAGAGHMAGTQLDHNSGPAHTPTRPAAHSHFVDREQPAAALAEPLPGLPSHGDTVVAVALGCCGDTPSVLSIPARLADRQTTPLLATAIAFAALPVTLSADRRQPRSAPAAAISPHRAPLVLRI